MRAEGDELAAHELQFVATGKRERAAGYWGVG
jgi:hypothetical protein